MAVLRSKIGLRIDVLSGLSLSAAAARRAVIPALLLACAAAPSARQARGEKPGAAKQDGQPRPYPRTCEERAGSPYHTFLAGSGIGSNSASQDGKPTGDKPAVSTQTLTLKNGDAEFKCYLAHPKGKGPFPGVLLVHEWWGLNDWVRQQADRLAEQGYAALALDLYRGELATDAEHAHELMRGMPEERALADMKLAFEFLSGHGLTRGRKVGVMGWCMGGGQALALAVADKRVSCTVVCYGRPITDPDKLKRISGPLLGIWGADDRGIDVAPFKAALKQAGVKATHHVHAGAGHAFMNVNNQKGYNETAAAKAWEQIDAFLAESLAR